MIVNIFVYDEVNGYPSPSVIAGDDLQSDIGVIRRNLRDILELTIGFETNTV